MNTVVLHNYFRSSTSVRVRIALKLKGIAYDYVSWNLRAGEHRSEAYRAINPQCVVPSLAIDGQILTQSIAIMEYLDETVPTPALLPSDAAGRARVRALAAMIACDIHPLNNLKVLNYLESVLHADTESRKRWFIHWVVNTFDPLEEKLAGDPSTGNFCHGDQPGLADICLYAQVLNNQRFGIALDHYPTIKRIWENCSGLEAFSASMPLNQPDAV